MKKIIFIMLMIPVLVNAQDQNYVKTTTYKAPGATSPVTQITFFDGLGRPIQQVATGQSATGNDIVTHMEYDGFGRQSKEFLPYASATTSVNYNPNAGSETGAFYNTAAYENTTNPFSEKRFDGSPLNRVLEQSAPGDPWNMANMYKHTIRLDYQANTSTDAVKLFVVTTSWNDANKSYSISLAQTKNYPQGDLYKTITKDENWSSGNNNTTQEFKDKEGKVILKRTFNNNVSHDTYYG